MKTFTESERFSAQQHLKIAIPGEDEAVSEYSWAELHEKRSATRKATGGLLDKAKKDNRDLSEAEEFAFNVGMKFLDELQDEFDRRDISGQKEPVQGDEPYKVTTKRSDKVMNDKLFTPRKYWRDIFGRDPRKVEGCSNFGEVVRYLHEGNEEKLRELRTMNTISGVDGGFSVPEVTWAEIFDSALEASVCLDLVTSFPMTSDTLHVSAWDSADKTQGPIGSVVGQWLGETSTATKVNPKLRVVTYNAHKLAMFLACSSEVLQDSAALAQSIGPMMRNSLAFSLDEAVLTGSGIARPLGVLNSPAAISVSRATAGSITFADLTGMMARLLPSSLSKATWLCSPSTFGTLVGLVTAVGSGELVMGFQPGASDIKMQILGRPVRVTEKLPALASKGSLMLADLTYYGLATRETGRFEKTNAAQFTSDIVDFRMILRCDGKPMIAKPFTPSGGGVTLSPFVVLE